VIIGEKSIKNLPPYKREIGMVFQNYALFPHMSVSENIAFPLKMRRIPRINLQKMVDDALGLVRLDGFSSRKPAQLSGGQQQRVALARAIVYHPPVLLMDEPLGALDKKLREQVQLEIKHLQKKLGITMIYVTHDQSEALILADRIAVLNKGKLQQIGSPEEIYERPVNSFVAGFIGEMNFMKGILHYKNAQSGFVSLDDGLSINIRISDVIREDFEEGMTVILAIRPECISIRPVEDNEFEGPRGVIEEVIYLGETISYVIQLSPTVRLTSRSQLGGRNYKWKIGESVKPVWDPQEIHCFKE